MLLGGLSTVITIFVLHLHHKQSCERITSDTAKQVFTFLAKLMFMSSIIPEGFADRTWEQDHVRENKHTNDLLCNSGSRFNGEKFVDGQMLTDATQKQYLTTLVQLRDDMAYIRLKAERKEHQDRIHCEWKVIALIIDRFSFWMCVALIFAGSVIVIHQLNT